jgi:hypothetical protein
MAKSGMHWTKEGTKALVFIAVVVIIFVVVLFVSYIGGQLLPTGSSQANALNNVTGAVNHGINLLASPLILVIIGIVALFALLYLLHMAEVI